MKKNLIKLSEKLNISGSEFTKRGLLNPSINGDTPLFIDPRLLKKSKFSLFSSNAQRTYEEYYEKLAAQIKIILKTQDATLKKKMELNLIKQIKSEELDGLCLGYADGNPGQGVGDKYAKAILNNALELYENHNDDPIIFSLLHLLTEGIGADYIGDITAKIIKNEIYEFTAIMAKEMQIPTEKFSFDEEDFYLPVHPSPPKRNKKIPILILPRDILNDLPVDANLEDVFNGYLSANDNDLIRQGVNNSIGKILANNEKKSNKQEELLKIIKENNDVMNVLGAYVQSVASFSYDFDSDKKGVLLRDKILAILQFENMERPQTQNFTEIVKTLVNEFKKFLDKDNDAKRLLLWKNNGQNEPESHWQKVFHIFAHIYLEKNNIDLTPESVTGIGIVDFKATRGSEERILIELKLSKNLKFKQGLSTQLEAYKNCFDNIKDSYFIYIDLDKDPSISNQKRFTLNKIKDDLSLKTNLIFINGRYSSSASKL